WAHTLRLSGTGRAGRWIPWSWRRPSFRGRLHGVHAGASPDTAAIAEDAWHQVSGQLRARVGAQSALFSIGASEPCEDFCTIAASFDDLAVEDTVVPDTTPPETTISFGPAETTTSTSASFVIAASERATFECALDGGASMSWTLGLPRTPTASLSSRPGLR